jgi:hypothetical protein
MKPTDVKKMNPANKMLTPENKDASEATGEPQRKRADPPTKNKPPRK